MLDNKVPLNDLSRLDTNLKQRISDKIGPLAVSGAYILGDNVVEFENLFCKYVGSAGCVSVANGTDALVIALRSIGVGPGDVILNVANAGGYTTVAANLIGAEVIFFDVEASSLHASLSNIRKAFIASRAIGIAPKALVVTHLFGRVNPEIEQISAFARENSLALLEDCAQAAGARLGKKHAGTFGDVATISFYPTKNLGASGDAGAIFSSNTVVLEKAKNLRQYGWSEKYKIDLAGGQNSRMDEIQAAILHEKLPHLDSWNSKRREIYDKYLQHASKEIEFMAPSDDSFAAHLMVVRHKKKSSLELSEHFANFGISTGVHYPVPDNRQAISLKYRDLTSTSVTDQEVKRIISIPIFPEMTPLEVSRVCEALAHA